MAEKYGKKTKKLMIDEMKEVFSENKGFIFSSINNIKASEIDKLRKKMRQSGSYYMVLKNRLAERALKDAGIESFSDKVNEKKVLGIGLIKKDPVQVAKLMAEFAKANKGFKLSEGYLEGQVLAAEKVKELSELPGREQLIAMVVNIINAPISGFVGVLGAINRSLVCVMNAIKEKKEKE